MKILLADDDEDLVDLTTYVLLRQGHSVLAAFTGEQALQRWSVEQPDLVLLDVVLPQIDGLDVCRQIRERSAVPIIMISGRGDEAALVRGYECGADDYIPKPFSPRQLLVRINTLMRRVANAQSEEHGGNGRLVEIADLVINPAAFEARKNGQRIALTRLEFRILHCMALNAGTLVDVHRLADYAWQSPTGGDAGLLKTHVSHIRQKLTEVGGPPVNIRAIPRTGYILSTAEGEPIGSLLASGDGD